ncbi:hypothetical protein EJ05DRAFT_119077 [Pseudovirgaria hyperparasitica]|uniref:Uncharacterized protein n=1 Tax=Pseudovirgaria hyperparasitica TaxID=470096 RepID=A0A6A6VWF9_9PEZI|nr:uncharacterized protein EJ05DRAFT_119077 [Pseudovirgaria hyperparasitica]KAF2755018.1 hypothetical protein EJ05DRAFT_119077 [Pseudovirgaria hyperparasitica]
MTESASIRARGLSSAEQVALGIGVAFAVIIPCSLLYALWNKRCVRPRRCYYEWTRSIRPVKEAAPRNEGVLLSDMAQTRESARRPSQFTISAPRSVYSPVSSRAGVRSLAIGATRQDSIASDAPSRSEEEALKARQAEEAVDLYRVTTVVRDETSLLVGGDDITRLAEFHFPFHGRRPGSRLPEDMLVYVK